MKLNKKDKEELMQVYNTWWNSYLTGDVKTYDSFLDEEFRFVGSTNNEEFLSRKDTTDFFDATADQLAGKAELRNTIRKIEVLGNGLVLITDLADAYVVGEPEWVFYSRFRFTCLLRKTENGWRFIYQHFSAPDTKAQEGKTLGLDKISKENQDLRDAIKRRTVELEQKNRELVIETTLERVRAIAMTMYKPEDLSAIGKTIFSELKSLGFQNLRNTEIVINKDEKETVTSYHYSDYGKEEIIEIGYKENSIVKKWAEDLKKAEDAFVPVFIPKKEMKSWEKYRLELGYKPDPKMESAKSIHYYSYSIGLGALSISSWQTLSDDQIKILERFRNVFRLSYQRYKDIESAEAQAHEAQIEVALERIRARTMGMQKGEEVKDVVVLLYKELIKLGVTNFATCGYVEINEKTNRQETWVTNPGGDSLGLFYLPLTGDVLFDERYEAWEKQQMVFHQTVAGKKRREHLEYAITTFNSKEAEEMVLNQFPDPTVFYCFNFSHGYLHLVSGSKLKEEEESLLARFTSVFQQTYTRFLDLQKAESQAREAHIEAALERIRSKSLAMYKTDDLSDVVSVLFEQMQGLSVDMGFASVSIFIFEEGSRNLNQWIQLPNGVISLRVPYFEHPISSDLFDVKESGADYFSKVYTVEEKNSWVEKGFELTDYKNLPEEFKTSLLEASGYAMSITLAKNSGICIPSFVGRFPSAEDVEIMKRVGKVFEQTYTRFLDLQKAEEQAREAKTELSLERIRAQVTAMKESSDLLDIVVTMNAEFKALGHEAHYFWHMRWLPDTYEKAMTSGDGSRIAMVMELPRGFHENAAMNDWEKNTEPSIVVPFDAEGAIDYVDKMIRLGRFSEIDHNAPGPDDIRAIGGLTFVMARTTHGEIGYSLPGKVTHPPEEDLATLVRFASVFDLAYRRFEDLKSAEKQNRETQIELALERVRAKTMAMHQTSELQDVINVVHQQFSSLNMDNTGGAFIAINTEIDKELSCWGAGGAANYIQRVFLPFLNQPIYTNIIKGIKKGPGVFSEEYTNEEKMEFFKHLFKHPPLNKAPAAKKKEILSREGGYTRSCVVSKYTTIFIINHHGRIFNDADIEILKRIGNVFEQSYTRFLDLQKAEAQAREAQTEAALERVRARALAMHQPEELKEVAQVLRHEMGLLGVEELETSSIYINDEFAYNAECWYAIKDVRDEAKTLVNDYFTLNLNDTWVGRKMLKFYHSDKEKVSIVMTGKPRIEWIRYCEEKSTPLRGYYGDIIPDRTYHLFKFSHGAIGAATPGDFSAENWGLLKRAASVFSLAYSRFKDLTQARYDLQELKEEKKKAEEALTELKSTQTQLIHAEKMASLGELTAGIAHEIQNPLNFVNNFSDVSVDLIEEMDEEITLGNTGEVKDIASDLKQNLEKIHHHGKRASFIVQGMLEHSRTNPGDKKLTDINILTDEFLRLSYHGLRAKDKNFNAEIISEFDKNLPEINVIPQDFGRVLLNLINNAFYACAERSRNTIAEKQKLQKENYKPTVLVSTQKIGNNLEIRVKDNGNGIPKEVLKKIFQPFFTTKPTGEGTGLGLSMSYDIITKGHGGKLEVETEEGKGSCFIINLPFE